MPPRDGRPRFCIRRRFFDANLHGGTFGPVPWTMARMGLGTGQIAKPPWWDIRTQF